MAGILLARPQYVPRGRTALQRHAISRPIGLALSDGLISKATTVFDYGCGHGADLRSLAARHIRATGWDPHHRPRARIQPADVVNLGYVLNVIEDPAERADTLRRAFALARQVLVVAARVDRSLDAGTEFGDGLLTERGTFQKIYTQAEFCQYVESVLEKKVHVASLGVAYVFASEEREAAYLASQAFARSLEGRADLLAAFARHRGAKRYVELANQLGRLPRPEEFPGYQGLVDAFGSPRRVERLTLHQVDRAAFLGSRGQRREDLLLYLAMMALRGLRPPPFHALPDAVRHDIKDLWKSYGAAQQEGREFLFAMGRPEQVHKSATEAKVGKLLPGHLYVHRSAEEECPALLRLILFAARQLVGEVRYDLAKIALDGQAVSFLEYDDFDHVAHPALRRSLRVYLPRASFDIRDYGGYASPPILHRKDAFVMAGYPYYEKFRELTEQEETFALLSSPAIGTLAAWTDLLARRGLEIIDHELRPAASRR